MKKVTLIAVAAAMATLPVLARTPRQQVAMQPKTMSARTLDKVSKSFNNPKLLTTRDMRRLAGYNPAAAETPTVPDDVVDVASGIAAYAPSHNAFYLGMSPAWASYLSTSGFTGIRNAIGFGELSIDEDSNEWLWREPVGLNEAGDAIVYKDHVSTDSLLRIELKPDLFFRAPVLKSVFDTDTVSYTPEGVVAYYCGGSPLSWDYTTAPENTPANEVEISDIIGVSVAAMPVDNGTWFPYNAYMRPAAMIPGVSTQFDANGTYSGWTEYFKRYTGYDYTNITVKAFSTIVPGMPSAYQLGSVWMPFMADLIADMTLTANVYQITEEGIDYEHPIAKGETIVKKDWNPEKDDLPVIFLEALDEDGYETESFPCISTNTPLVVSISGFDATNVNYFIPMMYEGSMVPTDREDLANDLYPTHATVQLNLDETPKGGTEDQKVNLTIDMDCPYGYYTSEAMDTLSMATDYMMFFDVEFPSIINIDSNSADNGTANFSTHFEKDGGTNAVKVFCDYNISYLLEQEEMKASASGDWITFTTKLVEPATDEDLPYTEVSITAAAMPEGMEGREGYVLFTGFACDFLVRISQGTVAGINQVTAAPAAGGAEFFDLQGRRLNAAPKSGLYIERNGSKAVKRIAR